MDGFVEHAAERASTSRQGGMFFGEGCRKSCFCGRRAAVAIEIDCDVRALIRKGDIRINSTA